MANNKILITGGMGNLGSWLTQYFVAIGWEVFVLTRNERKLEGVSRFNTIHCDISNEKDCLEKLSGKEFDYVVHCASVNDGFIQGYPKLAIDVNAWGTRNLLEALSQSNVKHFIYFSTFQVYGKYSGKITEETPLETKNDYGLSHLFAEGYVKLFHFNKKIPFTILRLTNSYGCPKDYDSSKWYLVLNDLARSALEKRKIILKSNGLAPRDFIWMGEVCKIVESLISKKPTNDIYNLSGERTYQMLEIAKIIQNAYFEKFNEEVPLSINEDDKSEYPEALIVSSSKLKTIVSYDSYPKFKEEAINVFNFLEKKL